MSPGSLKGRLRLSSDEGSNNVNRQYKRKNISSSDSPLNKEGRRLRIENISYDDPAIGKENTTLE